MRAVDVGRRAVSDGRHRYGMTCLGALRNDDVGDSFYESGNWLAGFFSFSFSFSRVQTGKMGGGVQDCSALPQDFCTQGVTFSTSSGF